MPHLRVLRNPHMAGRDRPDHAKLKQPCVLSRLCPRLCRREPGGDFCGGAPGRREGHPAHHHTKGRHTPYRLPQVLRIRGNHSGGGGATGPVKLIFTVIDRGKVESVVNIVQTYNPRAFYSIEDIRLVREGIFPPSRRFSDLLRMRKKE